MPPPDEGRKVALYTAVGVLASFVIFATMRSFAGPAPSTMTKEYQEQSNEFLRVRTTLHFDPIFSSETRVSELTLSRPKKPNPSPVSHPRATVERVWCSRRPSTRVVSHIAVPTLVLFLLSLENRNARHEIPYTNRKANRVKRRGGAGARWLSGTIRRWRTLQTRVRAAAATTSHIKKSPFYLIPVGMQSPCLEEGEVAFLIADQNR